MKFSLVAALVVVLAVTYGSEAKSLVRRDTQAEVEKISQLLKGMSNRIMAATQDMVEKVQAMELTNTAQTYVEDSRAKIQPLVDKVHAEAAKLQEQVKPLIANVEDHIRPMTANLNLQLKPMTDNVYDQVKPLTTMVEKLLKQMVEQTKALMPPQ